MAETTTDRHQWARTQAADALALRQARIAQLQRALADARRALAVAEGELMAAQQASPD